MTALVSIETLLLVLLVVLVAGLLRSHAEILRRLGPAEGEGEGPGDARAPGHAPIPAAGQAPIPAPGRASIPAPEAASRERGPQAAVISGTTLDGDAVKLDFSSQAGAPTLLAFLSSGCSVCSAFWEHLAEQRLPAGVQTVIVTHGAERERPARLRSIAPPQIPVVMSSQAWTDYAVPGSPYFVLVHGAIRGEGAAPTWKALASLVTDAIEDHASGPTAPWNTGPERAQEVDQRLLAAGIGPDHPSLYPTDD